MIILVPKNTEKQTVTPPKVVSSLANTQSSGLQRDTSQREMAVMNVKKKRKTQRIKQTNKRGWDAERAVDIRHS